VYRVLLLDVGTPRDELSEPIGLETIASYIESLTPDINITFKSLELDSPPEVQQTIASSQFDLVGISTKIRAYSRIHETINSVSTHSPHSLIVLGDIVSTFAYDKLLDIYDGIICVRGEGEESLPKIILSHLKHGDSIFDYLSEVPNIAYRANGKLITTRRSVMDLETAKHPKRFSLDTLSHQYGIVHLEASRGCIYSDCSFCGIQEKYNGTPWRPFTTDFVIEELRLLSNAGFVSPFFTDEDFFGNDVGRAIELGNKIISEKEAGVINKEMNFYFNARATSLIGDCDGSVHNSKCALTLLKKAGLREIFVEGL